MKANLAPILERWAELYQPIAHDPQKGSKNKAFYLIRTINDNSEFMRNQNTAKSPALAYSVMIDAEGTNGAVVNYQHDIYFLMRAKQTSLAKSARQDEEISMNAQMLMDDMCQDLLAYLARLKHTGRCPVTGQQYDAATMQALAGMQIDKANWLSLPVKYGEWHVLGLALEQNQPRNMNCINTELYADPTAAATEPAEPADTEPANDNP